VGGNLRVERTPGGGFRIDLEYPLSVDALSTRRTHFPPSPPSTSRSRASTTLVIDDEQASQNALLQFVAESGYRVIPVSTAEEAMDLCERMWFEWVFCAARIGRFTGLEIYERVHRQAGNFVLVEDAAASVDSVEVMSSERYTVLRKPFTAEDVSRILSVAGPANASSEREDAGA
jgi:DNA-binding NtrC family response regulator